VYGPVSVCRPCVDVYGSVSVCMVLCQCVYIVYIGMQLTLLLS